MFCQKIEFFYQGNTIIQQKILLNNSDTRIKIIDCLNNDNISTRGYLYGYKNQNIFRHNDKNDCLPGMTIGQA